jgi:hypothetical protein
MANLKKDAKIVARQDSTNYAVTVETLQSFMLSQGTKGNLLPASDDAYDLGSPTRQWRDLYLTGNSIYLGGIKLSDDNGALHVEDSTDPNAEIKFDLSSSLLADLKDVQVTGVEDGQNLTWNEAAGEWRPTDALSTSLHFYGVIGTDTAAGEILTPDGNEAQGDFYLVDGTHILNPGGQVDWPGLPDDLEVDSQDMVVKGETEWSHLNDIIGGGGSGVTNIVSETEALEVDDDIPASPRLKILNVTETVDGLMAKEDKVRLGELPKNHIQSSAPSANNSSPGDFWFDEDDASLSVYYQDVNGNANWISVTSELSAGQTDVNFDYISPSTVGTDFTVPNQNQVYIVRDPDVTPNSGVVFDWNRELDPSSSVPSDNFYSMVPASGSFGLGALDNPFAYLYADTVNAFRYDISSEVNLNPISAQPFVKFKNNQPLKPDGTIDTSQDFGFNFDMDSGNTARNRFIISSRHGDLVTINGGVVPQIALGNKLQNNAGQGKERGVLLKGILTPEEGMTYTAAANKGYVDAKIDELAIDVDIHIQTKPAFRQTEQEITHARTRTIYDEENNRLLAFRNYFHRNNDERQKPQLSIIDLATNTTTVKDLQHYNNAGELQATRQGLVGPIKVGDDLVFFPSEGGQESGPYKLTPDGDFDYYAGTNGLKCTKSWSVINFIEPLDDSGRYYLITGNHARRIDSDPDKNHSRQAQTISWLDTENLINQNLVESGNNGDSFTKSISASRGGQPITTSKGIYTFQAGKEIMKVNVNDITSGAISLQSVTAVLPYHILVDGNGDAVAEGGRMHGLKLINEHQIVFHLLNVGLYKFDIDDNSLELIHDTSDNWVSYGMQEYTERQEPVKIGKYYYYFPHSKVGRDGIGSDLYTIRVHENDASVDILPFSNDDNEFIQKYGSVSSCKRQGIGTKIYNFNDTDEVFVYDTYDDTWEIVKSDDPLRGPVEGGYKYDLIQPVAVLASNESRPYSRIGTAVDFSEYVDVLENDVIKDHDDQIYGRTGKPSAITRSYQAAKETASDVITNRQGIGDLVAPRVLVATEDKNYLQTNLMEHAKGCWPDEDHPYYHLIKQDYVLFMRMYEGKKNTDGYGVDQGTDNTDLDSDDYGNDTMANLMIFHIPTGKIKDLSFKVSHGANKYPVARGTTVVPREDGEVDVYLWSHNPRRNGVPQPLYRVHVPATANPSDPFANVTAGYTSITCPISDLTVPAENPYDITSKNPDKNISYQYEIAPFAFNVEDTVTQKVHYFMTSYNKGSTDFCTQRIFHIDFDESNPDLGSITPVAAHIESSKESYAGGFPVKKRDINGVMKCYLYGSPCGLTEVYFTGNRTNRSPEMRNYFDYRPLGNKVTDVSLNGIGQPLINEKGIVDNWYKMSTLAPQFVTLDPMDPEDYFSNIIVFPQSGYGFVSVNLADLGTIDRNREVRLENNFQGTEEELSSMMIETKDYYMSYFQTSSSLNLMRFNTSVTDTHSNGSLWFFDYKADYRYDIDVNGNITNANEESSCYNGTRVRDNNGNVTEQLLFKRPILQVTPNYNTQRLEIRAYVVGAKHYPTRVETRPDEYFTGESVVKMGDVFICTAAAKSHSSITKPRVYLFDPADRQIKRVSNEEVNATSLLKVPDHGLVMGSSYGVDAADNIGSKVHMVPMYANNKVTQDRANARTLRKLYAVTGDSIADDPNTWTEDPPQTGQASTTLSDFDSDQDEWDPI